MILTDELVQLSDYMKKIPKTVTDLDIDKRGGSVRSDTCWASPELTRYG